MQTLFIGLESDKQGNRLDPLTSSRAVNAIKKEAARIYGGYSASVVSGGWINESGELVEEKSLRLELATDDAESAEGFAAWSGSLLAQSCVLVSSAPSVRAFVPSASLVPSTAA